MTSPSFAPAQNTLPAPVKTIPETLWSSSSSSNAAIKLAPKLQLMALLCSGRFNVNIAMPSRRSIKTSGPATSVFFVMTAPSTPLRNVVPALGHFLEHDLRRAPTDRVQSRITIHAFDCRARQKTVAAMELQTGVHGLVHQFAPIGLDHRNLENRLLTFGDHGRRMVNKLTSRFCASKQHCKPLPKHLTLDEH